MKGTLLPNSAGTGTASSNNTWGTIDLGGASLQIAFYVPSQDISENLFKLQILNGNEVIHVWQQRGHQKLKNNRRNEKNNLTSFLYQKYFADSFFHLYNCKYLYYCLFD